METFVNFLESNSATVFSLIGIDDHRFAISLERSQRYVQKILDQKAAAASRAKEKVNKVVVLFTSMADKEMKFIRRNNTRKKWQEVFETEIQAMRHMKEWIEKEGKKRSDDWFKRLRMERERVTHICRT